MRPPVSPCKLPAIAGYRNSSVSSAATNPPCSHNEILRNQRSPSTPSSTPSSARKNAAPNTPLAPTAARCAAQNRNRCGGSVAAGSTSGARKFTSNSAAPSSTAIAATRAANMRRLRTGRCPITTTSSRSGNSKSHSKIVTSPSATSEYTT